MKKIVLVLCFAFVLSGCSTAAFFVPQVPDKVMEYSTEAAAPAMGTIGETTPSPETAPIETTTPASEIPKLSDEEIEAIDNKEIGYGQGRNLDKENRPVDALGFMDKYKDYDAYAMATDTSGNEGKELYLTFDQGYENGFTPTILDTLKEKGAHAIFFLTGDYVRKEPDLIQRMIDEGHVLGNHGNMHKALPRLSLVDGEKELQDCYDMVKEKFGYDMELERPPEGIYSERSLAIAQRLGYKSVLWSFAYRDWEVNNQPDPEEAYTRITEAAHDGGIFLLHSVSKTNTEILPRVIDKLQSDGYTLTTPEL